MLMWLRRLLDRLGLLPKQDVHYIGGSDTLPPPLTREREAVQRGGGVRAGGGADWDGNELLLSDVLGTEADTVMRPIEDDVDLSLLAAALDTLTPREREIITLRFGLGGRREQTQKEVADQMGISQSYISRLEKRIIQRLKKEILRLS